MDISAILKEDKRRTDTYFGHYDPFSGEGSLTERFPVRFSYRGEVGTVLLPVSMKSIPVIEALCQIGSIEGVVTESNLPLTEVNMDYVVSSINEVRMDHDFEYWAASTVTIQDKESKKPIPFFLNYPQRILLRVLERMRLAGVPIRIILLKARQWGGSTLVQIYMAWLQARHFTAWHSIIMADVEKQARNIRGMYTKMARLYPPEHGTITFRPYEGSQNTRIIVERECIVDIGSVQKPENTRSFDYAMAHLSEIGLWKTTASRGAEDLAQAISASIPRKPNTLIVKESTAKGVGNYFHNEWIAAEEGESGYSPVFIPWHFIPMYREPVKDVEKFIASWTENQRWQWEQGATIEGIMWYANFQRAERYTDWRMRSEFPTTSTEAFQSTGRRVFSPLYTINAKRTCKDPLYIGDLKGDSHTGKKALRNIVFELHSQGNLYVWAKPDSLPVSNRYCGFVDIGGRTDKADYSIIKMFDRYWMIDGGMPEVVAVWAGHVDQDILAWKVAQMGRWYGNALMAVEINSLKSSENEDEGDHSFTVLDEIAEHYPNLFTRVTPDQVRQGVPVKYGFHTNTATKGMIIDTLNGGLRDTSYIERDIRAFYEMEYFEYKPDGKMGAVKGRHDDHVIVTAGGLWLATKYKELSPPKEIVQVVRHRKANVVGESSF